MGVLRFATCIAESECKISLFLMVIQKTLKMLEMNAKSNFFMFNLIKCLLFVFCSVLFLVLMKDVFEKFGSKMTTTGVTFSRYCD